MRRLAAGMFLTCTQRKGVLFTRWGVGKRRTGEETEVEFGFLEGSRLRRSEQRENAHRLFDVGFGSHHASRAFSGFSKGNGNRRRRTEGSRAVLPTIKSQNVKNYVGLLHFLYWFFLCFF